MKTAHHHQLPGLQAGLTMIELLMALAVTAVALGATLPSAGLAIEKRHLDGAAAQLETDLMYTRSLAVASDRNLRMRFQESAGGSCYVVHTGDAAACSCLPDGSSLCTAGAQSLRSVGFEPGARVQLKSNVPQILFNPTLGTSTPTGTLRLLGSETRAVHLVVNLMGRTRACSPAGEVAGYRPC